MRISYRCGRYLIELIVMIKGYTIRGGRGRFAAERIKTIKRC